MRKIPSFFSNYFLPFAALFFVITGCSATTETTVVRTAPITVAPSDSDADERVERLPQKIRIGEFGQFDGFDPLFAENQASQRVIQLLYTGLTKLDNEGNVQASLAHFWQVSDDSLTYTFHLRDDIYFADSPIFLDGQGRKIQATDVAFVFLRMTNQGVPPNAARLFDQVITGFDAYNREQREIYNPNRRSLNTIGGIEVIDANKISFTLTQKTPDFLYLLATPYAVIYPREAVQTLSTRPVGSGAYRINVIESDTIFTLSRSTQSAFSNTESPALLQVRWFSGESSMLRALVNNEIDIIPDLPPIARFSIIDENFNLSEPYSESYNIVETRGNNFVGVYINPGNIGQLSADEARIFLNLVQPDNLNAYNLRSGVQSIALREPAQAELVNVIRRQVEQGSLSQPNIIFSDSMYEAFVARTSFRFASENLNMRLVKSGIVSREIFWYVRYVPTYGKGSQSDSFDLSEFEIMRFSTPRMAIFHKNISGFTFNAHPWWLSFDGVVLDQPIPNL